ncbi:MAG TPA: hypothetical protein VF980_17575 [Thermoanaerobaculia bacterium]
MIKFLQDVIDDLEKPQAEELETKPEPKKIADGKTGRWRRRI